MKKAILFVTAAVLSFGISAQQNVIDKYFQNYSNNDEFTKVHVTGKMFDLVSEIEAEEKGAKEIKEVAMSIDELNILVSEEVVNPKMEFNSSIKKLGSQFEELLTVQDKEGDASFYIDENNGIISELVIIAHGMKELVIISLTGNIELSKVSQIMKEVQMDHYMDKTSIENIDDFKVYPNPLRTSDKLTVELPEELVGNSIVIYDLQGKKVYDQQSFSRIERIDVNTFNKGQYILKVEKDDFSINRRFTVQ